MSQSIIIPAIAGIIKIRHTPVILPLLLCLYCSVMTEVLLYFNKNPTVINLYLNLYVLLEYFLLMWQLKKWGTLTRSRIFVSLMIFGLIIWNFSTFVYLDHGSRNFVFRLFYSFILVLCSINLLSKLAFERIQLMKDYRFLICIGFIVFYIYNILVEALCISSLDFSDELYKDIFNIKVYLNFAANIFYFIALLCIPKKKKFTL